MKRYVLALALAAVPSVAAAHPGGAEEHGAFLAGLLHPVTGLDHMAAMLAVGMWSAMTARRVWVAPLAFVLILMAGALLAQTGVAFPAVEPMIAASMLVIGLLLAARARLPEAGAALLTGAFALFHGAAHGQELSDTNALLGMVAGTALLHGLGICLGGLMLRQGAGLSRAAGATVALTGAGMAWSLVAG